MAADFTQIVQAIKKAAIEAVEASKPVTALFGTVVSVDPLQVKIDQYEPLDKTFLTIPEHILAGGLDVGDKVVLLGPKGGQRYVVIGKNPV